MTPGARVLIGTHTYAAPDLAARRQAAALRSLSALSRAEIVNVQFASSPHTVPGIETLAVLRSDSNLVTGRRGPRKPIVSEAFDALAAAAAARNCAYFCFTNGDIVFTQGAVERVLESGLDACVFSRQDVDSTGAPIGIEVAGIDVFAISTAWWAAHRRRFRPYIAGEDCWDNVYTAIAMCHARAAIENRSALVCHEAHEIGPRPSPYFGQYTRLLSALDAGYFTLWCRYWDGLRELRRQTASAAEEAALARAIFVWNPTLRQRAIQGGRNVKARVRYFFSRQRAAGGWQKGV